jgi:hypothetical protein
MSAQLPCLQIIIGIVFGSYFQLPDIHVAFAKLSFVGTIPAFIEVRCFKNQCTTPLYMDNISFVVKKTLAARPTWI